MRLSRIVGMLSAATAGIVAVPAAFGGTYTFQNGASNDFVDSYSGTQATTIVVVSSSTSDDVNHGGDSNVHAQNSSGNRYRFIMSFSLSALTPYASELTVTGASLNLTQAFVNSDSNFSPIILDVFSKNDAGWQQGTGTSAATTTGPWATGNAYAAVTSSTPVVRWKNFDGTNVSGSTLSGAGGAWGSSGATAYNLLYTQPGGTGYLDNAVAGTHDTITPTGNSAGSFSTTIQNWITNPSQNAGMYVADNGGSLAVVEFYQDTNATIANRPGLTVTLTSKTSTSNYTNANAGTDTNWSDTGDWDNGSPNTIGATANFGSAITAPQNVTVDAPQTVSALNFDNSNSYTLGGTGTITLLEVNTGQATISVASGNHTISAPISVRTNTTFNVTSVASTLSVTGPFTATNKTISKTGAGAVQLPNLTANALNISAGTVQIAQQPNSGNSGGTSVLKSLSVSGGALDLTNNGLVINYSGTSPLASIASAVASGSANGAWNGPGINSSTAAAVAADNTNPSKTGIGYAEASAIGSPGSFLGQSVNTNAVLVRYTLLGDSNLDGVVDTTDFTNLANDFGTSVQNGWVLGDFNGDGVVNALDFNAVATNFGQALPAPAMGTVVPEPTAVAIGVAAVLVLLPRRRRPELRLRMA